MHLVRNRYLPASSKLVPVHVFIREAVVVMCAGPACDVPFHANPLRLPAHAPGWLEGRFKVNTGANHVFGKTADAVGAGSNRVLLHSRDAAPVGPDAAGVTGILIVASEACWRGKIKSAVGTGYTESVSDKVRVGSQCWVMYDLRARHDREVVKTTDKRAVGLEGGAVGSGRAGRTARCAAELSVSVGSRRSKIDWRERQKVVLEHVRSWQILKSLGWDDLLRRRQWASGRLCGCCAAVSLGIRSRGALWWWGHGTP